MVLAAVELARRKTLEVGALAAVDVDDLDIVACLDEIGLRRCRLDALVQYGSASGSGSSNSLAGRIVARRTMTLSGVAVLWPSTSIGPPGAAISHRAVARDGESSARCRPAWRRRTRAPPCAWSSCNLPALEPAAQRERGCRRPRPAAPSGRRHCCSIFRRGWRRRLRRSGPRPSSSQAWPPSTLRTVTVSPASTSISTAPLPCT